MNNKEILIDLYKRYTKKHIKKIFLSVFFSVLVAGSTAMIAYLLDPAIEKIFIEKNQKLMLIIPIVILITFAVKGFSLYYAKITMISVGAEVTKKLQYDMMQNLIGTDTEVIDKKHSGKFISNITYDVNHITNLLSNAILALFKDTFTLLGLLSVMFLQNWKLATISIIMIPLASFSAKILGKRMGKVTTEAQVKSGILTTYLVELFKNHKLMKIFQKENYEKNRAYNYLTQLKEKNQKINTIFVRMSPIMEVLTGIMIATLIFYSGILISRGELDINNFFSFLAAMMLAYQPVRSLSALNMTFKQGLSAAERILPIIDKKNNIQDDANARPIVVKNSNIEFIDVNFSYENEKAQTLNTINMQFEGGKMTSLVGNSGAGKSTIMNLIPRFYDINSGDITIDNQSIYKTKINSLREQISMVSQETTLFDDTVGNNIKYANQDATEEEVYQVAKASFCEEFINKLPNKFGTLIGENGVRISGGEKQRISIARAMLKKSSIILLDEATSSLDSETESKIQKALNILTKDKTTIVIAHRLSTILNSNNIYLIESGKVIDSGRHEELLTKSKIYKNFYEKQIQK